MLKICGGKFEQDKVNQNSIQYEEEETEERSMACREKLA